MFEGQTTEDVAKASVASNDLERRREIGQFFTPELVATFIWEMLEIIHGTGFSKRTRVIDPACGEGVFLRVAADRGKVSGNCLFGVDIDETLLPAWHRDPRLQGAHLLLANGLLDHPGTGMLAGSFDVVVGNPPFAGKGVRDLLRLLGESGSTPTVPDTDLFGEMMVKERPVPYGPPLTPKERAAFDQLAKELGHYFCWRLGREQNSEEQMTNGSAMSELFAVSNQSTEQKNGGNDSERAAEMVLRWPQHRLLDPQRAETKFLIRRLAATAVEVFFMERFLRLSKPGGLIAVIVPESLVASEQLAALRNWLLSELELLAVVSLPQSTFTGVGANAKTSIVFARRLPVREESPERGRDLGVKERMCSEVFLAAPNVESPAYSLDRYLADVCQEAREHRSDFSGGGT